MNLRLGTTIALAAGLAILVAILVARPGPRTEPAADRRSAAPQQDTRTPIVLPPPARDAVLAEMRIMLRALHGTLNGLSRGDRAAAREAAAGGGMAIAADTDPAVRERLPEEFLRLGLSTHQAFDSLAAAIEAGASRDGLITRMAGLTSKCVACHAAYRIETP